jgi:hypothetical protein
VYSKAPLEKFSPCAGSTATHLSYDASLTLLLTWELVSVNRTCLLIAFAFASLLPVAARAVVVAATSIPNGTYTVKVVKVVDAKHIDVLFDNGQEATLPSGRSYVEFSKVQPNDQVELSVIDGNVMVYKDNTSH